MANTCCPNGLAPSDASGLCPTGIDPAGATIYDLSLYPCGSMKGFGWSLAVIIAGALAIGTVAVVVDSRG
jgi:hypothetical protein